MISSEYGWPDEMVLETPICRLRQISANIIERRKQASKREEILLEWQTKTLAIFIAQTSMGDAKALVKAAARISLRSQDDELEEAEVPGSNDPEVFVEQGSQKADNPAGSFERFMRGTSAG